VVSGAAQGDAVVSSAEWTMTIVSRKIQSKFSPLGTAISALHTNLVQGLPEATGSVVLRLGTVDRYSDRQVGWSASLHRCG